MKQGDRIELTSDVERFPHFIAKKGSVGTVIDVNVRDVSVRMDDKIEGCEEWENCLLWADDNRAEFDSEVKPHDANARCNCKTCNAADDAADGFKYWICINPECGHEVLAVQKPQSIKWTDGHVCHFRFREEAK